MEGSAAPRQPMCSMFVMGGRAQAVEWGWAFARHLRARGHVVQRNKVEARFANVTDGLPARMGRSREVYWEFHAKITVGPAAEHGTPPSVERIASFRQRLRAHDARTTVSRSLLSAFDAANTGQTSRIVTLRLYEGTKATARLQLQAFVQFLRASQQPFGAAAAAPAVFGFVLFLLRFVSASVCCSSRSEGKSLQTTEGGGRAEARPGRAVPAGCPPALCCPRGDVHVG